MKKKLAIETNEHLKDPEKRRKEILESVIGSSEIEGIHLTREQWEKIANEVDERRKKESSEPPTPL